MSADDSSPCCAVGARPDAVEIEASLRDGGPDNSIRKVAARHGLPPTAIQRHRVHLFQSGETGVDTSRHSEGTAVETSPLLGAPKTDDDPRTTPRKVITATIEERCVDLRIAGKSYREISAELGIDDETAIDAVERVLVRTLGRADRKAEHAREIEVRRCEAIIAAFWTEATGEKSEGQGRAADRVLRASERKAKLLGLDALTTGAGQIPFYLSPGFDDFLGVLLAPLQDHPERLAEVMEAAKGHIAMLAAQKPAKLGFRLIAGGRAS